MLTGLIIGLIVVAIISVFVAKRPAPPIDADLGPDKVSFGTATPADQVFKVADALPVSAAYKLGRADAAKDALEQGRRKDPYLDLEGFGTRFRDPALKRRLAESLSKAGLK